MTRKQEEVNFERHKSAKHNGEVKEQCQTCSVYTNILSKKEE